MDLGWFDVGLNVQDIARSLAFYQALGFAQVDGGVDIRAVTLQKADCRIGLYQGYGEDPFYLQFWQGDVDAIFRNLSAKGLRFDREPDRDETGVAARLRDPDGHTLFFINMPTYYAGDPAYAHPAPAYRPDQPHYPPREPAAGDVEFGWFEPSLAVHDIGRSRAFYETLGFEVVDDSVERNMTLRNNDCRLSLYQGYLRPARSQLIFWQGDVRSIAGHLAAKGLSFESGPASDDKGTGAMLIDPDGNPLYFVNIHGVTRT